MLQFFKRTAASVAAAATGKVRVFVDTDNLVKTRDEANVLRVLGDGIVSITLIATNGLDKTYRITRQSGATFDYVVRDGQNGVDGQGQPANVNPTSIDPDDAASIGTATTRYALQDHQHAIVTDAAVGLNGGSTSTEGTAASFARSDHTHAIANGGTPTTIQPDATANQGTATSLARSDHTHAIAADVPVALGTTAAEGTSASFARADHVHVNPVIAHEAAADPHPQYATDAQISNVRNPVAPNVHTTAPQTLNQTLTAAATMTIPANSLVAGDAFEIDVMFGTLVNTTAASNLEVAVFINGAQNAIALAALGTTAVAAPGRGGRALFKLVFRTVGAAGTAIANGTVHVNALANFASNNVTAQTVNTTAAVTLDVRVRTSAATSTGTVQFAAIDQAT